jgi:hypothetical protein
MSRKDLVKEHYTLHGSVDNKWFRVTHMQSGDEGVLLCQSKHKWHFFWSAFEGSASGGSPETAVDGSLGDVIGTDGEMASYKRIMRAAPEVYSTDCDGLYRNVSFVY